MTDPVDVSNSTFRLACEPHRCSPNEDIKTKITGIA